MSKSTIRLRKVGISTLAVAMSLGVAGVTASAASAAPTAPGLTAPGGSTNVTQGATKQAAGDLNYAFTNAWTTGATVTLSLPTPTCDTQANIDKAIEWAALPKVTITHDASTDTGRIPTFSEALSSSSAATGCATAGIQDVLTITLNQPSSGGASTDEFDINVSGITYNVGSNAATGAVNVTPASAGITVAPPTTPASNASVVNHSFVFGPLAVTKPGGSAALGTVTYSESTPGAYFKAGDNTVTLTVSGGTFAPGITPTIAVPSGYAVKSTTGTAGAPKTTETAGAGTATYSFVVTAPSTPAAATVSVSGLEFQSDGTTVGQETLDSSVGSVTDNGNPAVNVVNYGPRDRIGGADRYDTAARLFRQGGYASSSVVLASGQNFPDALSANYLAGELGTGTLLTKANSIPDATMNAILDTNVDTVYVVGGAGAVNKAVQDKLESTHVGGNVNSTDFINVVRLAGATRYATNQRINQWTDTNYGNSGTVLLANGTTPYDALAGGPVSYENGDPVVLTGNNGLDRGEEQQLIDLGATDVVILGDTGVVSQAEEDALKADGYTVNRLGGATRYGTAAAIATWASEGYDFNGDGDKLDADEAAQGFNAPTAAITNGKGFADALAAAPFTGSNLIPMVLSQGADALSADTAGYLAGKTVSDTTGGGNVGTVLALGQTGATSNSMIEDAAKSIETK